MYTYLLLQRMQLNKDDMDSLKPFIVTNEQIFQNVYQRQEQECSLIQSKKIGYIKTWINSTMHMQWHKLTNEMIKKPVIAANPCPTAPVLNIWDHAICRVFKSHRRRFGTYLLQCCGRLNTRFIEKNEKNITSSVSTFHKRAMRSSYIVRVLRWE